MKEGGRNEGGSHYIIENKRAGNLISGGSHYLYQNKDSYQVRTHYLYETKNT